MKSFNNILISTIVVYNFDFIIIYLRHIALKFDQEVNYAPINSLFPLFLF